MRRILATGVVLLGALAVFTACGEDVPVGTTPETIDISFSSGTVSPSGERVEVQAGQPIDLVVRSDSPGEIHVHSQPEQVLDYGTGTTTLKVTIDRPGVVEVESHELDQVIVQLEVR